MKFSELIVLDTLTSKIIFKNFQNDAVWFPVVNSRYKTFQYEESIGEKKLLLNILIVSLTSIYSERFSFLLCMIEKLEKSGFGWEHIWSWWPETTQHRFETFWRWFLTLGCQVLQALKVSVHSHKVDVIVVRFRKIIQL
jgi:hypothetical protein